MSPMNCAGVRSLVRGRSRSHPLHFRHVFAGRLDELSRDSAAGLAARRLGIEVWQTDSWTKTVRSRTSTTKIKRT